MKSSLTTNQTSNNTMSTFETNNNNNSIPFHYNISHKRRAKTPSFSSILLDAIYRSIDDNSDTDSSPKTISTSSTSTPTPTPTANNNTHFYDNVSISKHRRTKMRSDSHLETIELRHAIMIDSWIDKQPSPSPPTPPQRQSQQRAYYNCNVDNYNSKIRLVRQKSFVGKSSSSSCFTQPKMICTNVSSRRETSPRIFNKTKLKALKIYNDLRKNKSQNQIQSQQPISPGARFTAFLNSIFRNPGGSPASKSLESTPSSACSSLSSCLSKTTGSTLDKSKRSVRFYPVSVILDDHEEDYTVPGPCSGHVSSCRVNSSRHNDNDHHNVDDQKQLMSATAASDHQHERKWKRNKEIDELITMNKRNRNRSTTTDYSKEVLKIEIESDEEIMMMNLNDDEDEEDAESVASSDLFELDNLSSIGVSRFNQELPVYGTTSLKNLVS